MRQLGIEYPNGKNWSFKPSGIFVFPGCPSFCKNNFLMFSYWKIAVSLSGLLETNLWRHGPPCRTGIWIECGQIGENLWKWKDSPSPCGTQVFPHGDQQLSQLCVNKKCGCLLRLHLWPRENAWICLSLPIREFNAIELFFTPVWVSDGLERNKNPTLPAIYLYIYIYIYFYLFIYLFIYLFTYLHHTYAFMYMILYIYIYISMYSYIFVYLYIYIYIYT